MRKGFSLGSVLLVCSVALVAALSLGALTTSGLNLTRRTINTADARELAEAALAEALGRLHANRTFGTHAESVDIRPNPAQRDRFAVLTFDSNRSGEAPLSSAQLAAQGSGGSVHLFARGCSGGVSRTVEMLLAIPPYEFAIGVAGSLDSPTGFSVSGVDGQSPGSLAANGPLQLSGPVHITGDLLTALPVGELFAGSVVSGRIVSGEPADLPFLDVSNWDPRGIPELAGQRLQLDSDRVRELTVNQAVHTDPAVNLLVDGNLNLEKGLLYVDGDLVVRGRVLGTGAVVVAGSTRVAGSIDLAPAEVSGSQVALLSRGDVTLTNQQGGNFFQGLVYTQGNSKQSEQRQRDQVKLPVG